VTGFPWLTATVFLPAAGAVMMAVVAALGRLSMRGRAEPRAEREAEGSRWWTLVVTTATFVVSVGMFAGFDGSVAGMQLVERASWVGPLNFQYVLGVDGISVFLVLLTTFLMPLAVLASWRIERQVPYFMVALLLLETAVLGAFVALDLLLFFVFFEGLLFPMYLIIGVWGYERRIYAAVKFFLFTMAGSAFLLVAILFLYFRAGSDLGQATFLLAELEGLDLPVSPPGGCSWRSSWRSR
jgi:NADH-quinone oxidoreductase subunit M